MPSACLLIVRAYRGKSESCTDTKAYKWHLILRSTFTTACDHDVQTCKHGVIHKTRSLGLYHITSPDEVKVGRVVGQICSRAETDT